MSDLYFTVDQGKLDRSMDRLAAALSYSGLGAFLEEVVGPYLTKRAKDRFNTEGDSATGKWQPLAPATQVVRANLDLAIGPDAPINIRTGEMYSWATDSGWSIHPVETGAELTFPGAPPTGELATKVATAQRGKAYPATPPRPILAVDATDLGFVVTELSVMLAEVWS